MKRESANITIRNATINDVPLIHEMAHAIWPVTYGKILSAKQLEYMLNLIYSSAALEKQMTEGHQFIIAEESNLPVGFADYNLLRDDVYKLQKVYVLTNQQGKGIGGLLIDHIIRTVKEKNAKALLLNVNRNNKAKEVYEHLGFKVISEEDIDIGEGYFMNDYIMQLKLD